MGTFGEKFKVCNIFVQNFKDISILTDDMTIGNIKFGQVNEVLLEIYNLVSNLPIRLDGDFDDARARDFMRNDGGVTSGDYCTRRFKHNNWSKIYDVCVYSKACAGGLKYMISLNIFNYDTFKTTTYNSWSILDLYQHFTAAKIIHEFALFED